MQILTPMNMIYLCKVMLTFAALQATFLTKVQISIFYLLLTALTHVQGTLLTTVTTKKDKK